MRYKLLIPTFIFLAATAFAKEPKAYQSGQLLQMDSVQCGNRVDDKNTNNLGGEMPGTDSGHNKTQKPLCQEYLLQTDKTVYRIRPKDAKHPLLLPIGERAQFRLEKNKFLLRVHDLGSNDLGGKERECVVVSIAPRGDSTADAHAVRLNHLQ